MTTNLESTIKIDTINEREQQKQYEISQTNKKNKRISELYSTPSNLSTELRISESELGISESELEISESELEISESELEISNDISKIKEDVIEILIREDYIDVFLLQILDNIDLPRTKHLQQLVDLLRVYFNEGTIYHYDKETEKIVSISDSSSTKSIEEFHKDLFLFLLDIKKEERLVDIQRTLEDHIIAYKEQIEDSKKIIVEINEFDDFHSEKNREGRSINSNSNNKEYQKLILLLEKKNKIIGHTRNLIREVNFSYVEETRKHENIIWLNDSKNNHKVDRLTNSIVSNFFPLKLPRQKSKNATSQDYSRENWEARNNQNSEEKVSQFSIKNILITTTLVGLLSWIVNMVLQEKNATVSQDLQTEITDIWYELLVTVDDKNILPKEESINIPISLTEKQLNVSELKTSLYEEVIWALKLEKIQIVEIWLHPEQDILMWTIIIQSIQSTNENMHIVGNPYRLQQFNFYSYRKTLEKDWLLIKVEGSHTEKKIKIKIK